MKSPILKSIFHVQFSIENSKAYWTSPGDLQLEEKRCQGHGATFTVRFVLTTAPKSKA